MWRLRSEIGSIHRRWPALKKALHDEEPLVRGHAAWALGQIGGGGAKRGLQGRLRVERHPEVITEIKDALREM